MAILTFRDRAGAEWQVFQVRRTSQQPGAVSPGREEGWLSFTSGGDRRRLGAFPPDWEGMTEDELLELCDRAERVPDERTGALFERRATPRTSGAEKTTPANPVAAAFLPPELEQEIRASARHAKSSDQTVVDAMIEFRRFLASHGIESTTSEARLARRCFLDTYYFNTAE